MTREDFLSLPPTVALRILFDALDEETSAAVLCAELPKRPLPPKYDYTIYRQGGVQFASETAAEDLRFWHDRAAKSAAGNGDYAARDKKNAELLARWIAWREWYPDAAWSGTRGERDVVAALPSAKPAIYQSQRRNGATATPRPSAPQRSDDIDPDADIPF